MNLIMKRIFLVLLVLISVILFQSCKKDGPGSLNGKTYLIAKIITHYQNSDWVEQFTYDDKNRLASAKYQDLYQYNYSYDNSDRLIEVLRKDFKYQYDTTFTYIYTGNKIIEDYKVNFDTQGHNGRQSTYTYEVNDGKIVKARLEGGTVQDPFYPDLAFEYGYDSMGNIIKIKQFDIITGEPGSQLTFGYDNKRSPFSMVKGFNQHLMYLGPPLNYSAVNNRYSFWDIPAGISYKYNSAGFPVTAELTNIGDITVSYEYIIK